MPVLSTHSNTPPQCLHPASPALALAPWLPVLPCWGLGTQVEGPRSAWAGTYAISQENCPNQGISLGLTQFLFLGLSNQLLQEWRGA